MAISELLSAGYFLTARVPRPAWSHGGGEFLPPSIVALSPCLAPVVPSGWPSPAVPGFHPSERDIKTFGLTDERRCDIESYVTVRHEQDPGRWPWVPLDLEEARAFARHVAASLPEVLLVGVALPAEDLTRLQSGIRQGISERSVALGRGLAPAEGGTVLGHEVLGDGVLDAHSIICTGGEVDLARDLSIPFNSNGLIDDLGEARRAAAWASGEGHAEPTEYFAWRLTQYVF